MIREWRNLELLMRGGRGHTPEGVAGTKVGELAVRCRACPHPGINLPGDFEAVAPDQRYLYRQTISVDCNFRLKNRHRSTNMLDVRLSPGWSYFVERDAYMEHVRAHATQTEVNLQSSWTCRMLICLQLSTCSGFSAMLLANLKKAKGLNATGVVGVACARHEHWRPNGMGDLQRGERYVYQGLRCLCHIIH